MNNKDCELVKHVHQGSHFKYLEVFISLPYPVRRISTFF
jgi:hypothetical protein